MLSRPGTGSVVRPHEHSAVQCWDSCEACEAEWKAARAMCSAMGLPYLAAPRVRHVRWPGRATEVMSHRIAHDRSRWSYRGGRREATRAGEEGQEHRERGMDGWRLGGGGKGGLGLGPRGPRDGGGARCAWPAGMPLQAMGVRGMAWRSYLSAPKPVSESSTARRARQAGQPARHWPAVTRKNREMKGGGENGGWDEGRGRRERTTAAQRAGQAAQ